MRYSHCGIHSAVNHSGGCVALDQITYRSPSCTLLLQRGRQPPGRLLYIWALCPSSVLASFLISSSSSPSFTLLSPPLTSSDLLPLVHPPPRSFPLYPAWSPIHPHLPSLLFYASLYPLSLSHMFGSSPSVPSMRFLWLRQKPGGRAGLARCKVGREICRCHACWRLRD